jgi:hypothetical protein
MLSALAFGFLGLAGAGGSTAADKLEPFTVPRELFRLPPIQPLGGPEARPPQAGFFCTLRVIENRNTYDRGIDGGSSGDTRDPGMVQASTCLPDPDTVTYWGR